MRKKILLATIAFLFGTLLAWAGGTPSLPLNYQARIINGKFYVVRMLASPDPAPQGTFINSRGLRVDGAGTLYAISPAMAASPTIINSILGVAVDANGYLIVSLSGSGAGFPITNSVHVASGGTITWDSGGALVLASGSTFTPNTSIIPGTDNAIDLGSASKSWRNFYITGSINFLGSGLMSISGTPGVCGTAASNLGQMCLSSTGNRFVYSYNTGANTNFMLFSDLPALPAGTVLGSADTGSPAFTFAANSISANEPFSNTNSVLTTPNLGTPSAINLSNATNLPAAALPLQRFAFTGAPSYSTAGSTSPSSSNARLAAVYFSAAAIATAIFYSVTTADNTSNAYDIGLYGPGCYNGAANIPLVVHTGLVAGTTLAPATGLTQTATTGSGVILPGWYCLAFATSASTSINLVLGGGGAILWAPFNTTNLGVTAGALPSTITAPALNWARNQWLYIGTTN